MFHAHPTGTEELPAALVNILLKNLDLFVRYLLRHISLHFLSFPAILACCFLSLYKTQMAMSISLSLCWLKEKEMKNRNFLFIFCTENSHAVGEQTVPRIGQFH